MIEQRIIGAVCDTYGITPDQLDSEDRKYPLNDARKAASIILRENMNISLKSIGKIIGPKKKFDHTTIVYNLKVGYGFIRTDKCFAEKIASIRERIAKDYPPFTSLSFKPKPTR